MAVCHWQKRMAEEDGCILEKNIHCKNYSKRPIHVVATRKWVRVDNIGDAHQDQVFFDVLGIPKVPSGTLTGSFLLEGYFGGKIVHTEPRGRLKMGPEWAN